MEEGDKRTHPIDVSNIPDRPRRMATTKLGANRCVSKVAGHGEIRNGGGSQDDDGQLVEDALAAGKAQVPADESEV